MHELCSKNGIGTRSTTDWIVVHCSSWHDYTIVVITAYWHWQSSICIRFHWSLLNFACFVYWTITRATICNRHLFRCIIYYIDCIISVYNCAIDLYARMWQVYNIPDNIYWRVRSFLFQRTSTACSGTGMVEVRILFHFTSALVAMFVRHWVASSSTTVLLF